MIIEQSVSDVLARWADKSHQYVSKVLLNSKPKVLVVFKKHCSLDLEVLESLFFIGNTELVFHILCKTLPKYIDSKYIIRTHVLLTLQSTFYYKFLR